MRCPSCGKGSHVLDSRITGENALRRRRECDRCKKRFTTYERIESANLLVVKKDGQRERFDRQKVLDGILKACEKRPVSMERIEQAADRVENALREGKGREVPSQRIGDLVMKELKRLDKVAYIRFASVYREFTDLESFQEELRRLLKRKKGGR